MNPILYSFRRCPYAMRARMALDAAQIPITHREILLKNKPAKMIEASCKGTVPVLVLDEDHVLDESMDIMHWALAINDPEHWQRDPALADKLISRNDGQFKHHLDRYKYASRYEPEMADQHRHEGLLILQDLEQRLTKKPFLGGETAFLGDIALFPFVRQFRIADPVDFDHQPLPRLQSWLNHFLQDARFARVMKKHPLYHEGDNDE